VFTSTTPLSGTLVTTYTYDAANRLATRSASDGRAYVYEWSQRGQLLAENTQGVDVRTFTYDGAGRLVEATVFTLTTRFTYDGLGARTHIEVVGHGTTTVTLDYAAGNQILAETTLTGTVQYLYGRDCLGELRDEERLYYLNDGDGLVRQGVDAEGEIVSAWLFDPDGTVLEGPEGPVSHLVCGGMYDWSTGLVYKDGRYFDPMLGIWLALAPLVVVQWASSCSPKRKERRSGLWTVMLALFLVGVSGLLTGCEDYDKFAEKFVCTDIPDVFQPKSAGECRVDSVYRHPPEVVAKTDDPNPGFYLDKWIVFCLEEGVDAEQDCKVGSWTMGYMRSKSVSDKGWKYPQGKVFVDVGYDFPSVGVDYNGSNPDLLSRLPAGCPTCSHQRIVFHDWPGFHALYLPEPAIYEVNHQFWTVLYDGSDARPGGEELTEQDWIELRDDIQPVWVETWFFCGRAEVDDNEVVSVAHANY
jgi:YD repeat-containing protein